MFVVKNGVLTQVGQSVSTAENHAKTDLEWKYAMQRRGLALHMAGVMSYGTHEDWIDVLLEEHMRVPVRGYKAPTWDQIYEADVELFTLLADKTRKGLKREADEKLPADRHFKEVLNNRRIGHLLTPLGGGGGQASGRG